MKKQELRLVSQMAAEGFSVSYLKRHINWPMVRANPEIATEAVYRELLKDAIGRRTIFFDGRFFDDRWRELERDLRRDAAHERAFRRWDSFLAVDRELENCDKVFLCRVYEGDYATIEVSLNGSFWPGDDAGTVEITSVPAEPEPMTIKGNGTVTTTGPKMLYAHLDGPEDECDIEVRIQRPK